MSLATQLARGTLALPMLLAFAGLGLVANQRAEAEPVGFTLGALVPAETGRLDGSESARQPAERDEQRRQRHMDQQFMALERLGEAQARAAAALPALGQQFSRLCGARGARNHVLVLAQAPADLGTLAVRFNTGCRA